MPIKPMTAYQKDGMHALRERGVSVPECDRCGAPRRSQYRYCSEACRKADYRELKEFRPELRRVCARCGDVFFTRDPRRVNCSYEEAEPECQEAYDSVGYVKEDSVTAPCGVCGKPVGGASTGRPRCYCSRACQQRAYRQRRKPAASSA
ncbi:hypothetical protein [Streptomyces sp. NA04227]|uniref:hypothetical protein n=1 Tax=Streptomyces sp. NA04227 TaxID=2742136 RepID=UPI001C379C92|nr:hypothetical protein [Streptomyces sp. NA04227]